MTTLLPLGSGLFGLLELPETGSPAAPSSNGNDDTAVVLLNAGFIHRSGPFRMSTRLARAIAHAGYPVLRFDAPGIGDAIAAGEQADNIILGDVLDRLQAETGCTRFIVGGLCSAADASWKAAQTDARISGLILLDGVARGRTLGRLVRLRRLLRGPPERWVAAMRRRLSTPLVGGKRISDAELRDWPAEGQERHQLQAMLDRGIKVFALYTGGTAYFLHRWQFRSTFGRAASHPGMNFEHWRQCDHTFYLPEHRDKLIARVSEWVRQAFPHENRDPRSGPPGPGNAGNPGR